MLSMHRGAVLAFADLGAKVAICDINTELGEEVRHRCKVDELICPQLASTINKTYPNTAIFVKTNVTSEDDIKNAVEQTVEKFGRIGESTVAGPH